MDQPVTEPFDVQEVRAEFPAFAKNLRKGTPPIFFDNPAGTQISARSLNRMMSAMTEANSNLGGFFDTSVRASELVAEARVTAAAFVNAPSPDEIVFGPSMTALTFVISRAIGTTLKAGDAILLTRMDHDANVAPWLNLAAELQLEVRWLDFDPEGCEFDLSPLDQLVDAKLKLAAVNYASNVTGTINDVETIARCVRAVGGLVYVDAVQFAPHGGIDVQALDCDFVVCSAYKFFGPHQAMLWGKSDLLDALPSQRVRPAPSTGPGKWEQGTKSREAIAGVMGAIEHFAWLGTRFGGAPKAASMRERITAGLAAAENYERRLTASLIRGLSAMAPLRIHGLASTQTMQRRLPTVSFTAATHPPGAIAMAMAEHDIQVWSGHNYGIEPVRRLGLDLESGVVRVGLAHYNTEDEVERFLNALGRLLL